MVNVKVVCPNIEKVIITIMPEDIKMFRYLMSVAYVHTCSDNAKLAMKIMDAIPKVE